jgi:endonuclease VIII
MFSAPLRATPSGWIGCDPALSIRRDVKSRSSLDCAGPTFCNDVRMPEGDTVKNAANALTKALAGQTVSRSDFRVPALATTDLAGYRILECGVRGKHLLLRFTSPEDVAWTLHSHLRMDGAWRTFRTRERPPGRPAHTIRVILTTETSLAIGYNLHDIALLRTDEEAALLDYLGPDLLGPDWDPDEAVRRLSAQPDREIADALLDQRNLAGIGNLYKSEALFLRGIWPWRPVREAGDLHAMVTLAQRMLASNVGRWTQTTTGSLRRGAETYVYGRIGQPCRRCGTLIQRREQGEHGRVTFWCPSCQPAPE